MKFDFIGVAAWYERLKKALRFSGGSAKENAENIRLISDFVARKVFSLENPPEEAPCYALTSELGLN